MASQLISFRLSEAEIEALQAQSLEGESVNLTAQRLLRNALGLSTSVDSHVDRLSLDEQIESILDSKVTPIISDLNLRLFEFEEQLKKL